MQMSQLIRMHEDVRLVSDSQVAPRMQNYNTTRTSQALRSACRRKPYMFGIDAQTSRCSTEDRLASVTDIFPNRSRPRVTKLLQDASS
jgi:hypothetical protein